MSCNTIIFGRVLYPFVAGFICRSMVYQKTVPMTRVQTRYSRTVADMTGDKRQRALREEELHGL